jgi:Anti-sigma-28 factor, FlgM
VAETRDDSSKNGWLRAIGAGNGHRVQGFDTSADPKIMAKEPTSAGQGRWDENRTARVRRIREEVREGRYRVDGERLGLCMVATWMGLVQATFSGRGIEEGRSSC